MRGIKTGSVSFLLAACLILLLLTPSARAGDDPSNWPFKPYAYAKAYTFNFFPARHGVQLRIIENGRWSSHIRSQLRIDQNVAAKVAGIVASTKGTYEVSKCPFPRHAFVYFSDKDQPIASVDICFECGDLFAWPDFKVPDEDKYGAWDDKKDTMVGGIKDKYDDAMKEYRKVIADLGLPIDPRRR